MLWWKKTIADSSNTEVNIFRVVIALSRGEIPSDLSGGVSPAKAWDFSTWSGNGRAPQSENCLNRAKAITQSSTPSINTSENHPPRSAAAA